MSKKKTSSIPKLCKKCNRTFYEEPCISESGEMICPDCKAKEELSKWFDTSENKDE